MPTYLRHTPTGDLYIFTSALAKRKDMELVEEVTETPLKAEKPPKQTPKPNAGRSSKKNAAAPVEAPPAEESVEEAVVDALEDLELDVPLADEFGE
jgi:hypothetical protein